MSMPTGSQEGEKIMIKDDNEIDNHSRAANDLYDTRSDPLGNSDELISQKIPPGVDRRKFLMRSAVIGAATVMTGRFVSAHERTLTAVRESLPVLPQGPSVPLDKNLNVVKKGQGPVMTVIDEFYKVG